LDYRANSDGSTGVTMSVIAILRQVKVRRGFAL